MIGGEAVIKKKGGIMIFWTVIFIVFVVGLFALPIIVHKANEDKIIKMILENERNKRTDIKYED